LKLHILGIAGTFMGGVAALARELGHGVEGSDQAVYPPMSTQLEQLGIVLKQGYRPEHISPDCDTVVIGNALSRGNAAVEAVLDSGRAYTSGAEWLRDHVLPGREVIAVSGTHGKTTTTTILAFLLQAAGREPGFLIGGVAEDFGVSARLGASGAAPSSGPAGHLLPEGEGRDASVLSHRPLFVVEADEYDTAFFDKRSKFVHYRPRVAILNNLEYDHADIFPDIAAIQRQFHHFVRTVPGNGRLLVNELAMRPHNTGHWTQDGAVTSQFENHLRAVMDLPLGSPAPRATWSVMVNILGSSQPDVGRLYDGYPHAMARDPHLRVHLYGKEMRPGRKVGHVNVYGDDLDDCLERARHAADWFQGDLGNDSD
jgi:UDP-N-acetylmuramate:L-alanyl-gamma-D-glutamyl-meso-diaminopimelate ligase